MVLIIYQSNNNHWKSYYRMNNITALWRHDWSMQLYTQLKQLYHKSLKEIQAWMGFEPMTSAMQVQVIYLNCGERYEDMTDNRSYTHSLSSCEIKAWKKFKPERDSNPWALWYRCIHLHRCPSQDSNQDHSICMEYNSLTTRLTQCILSQTSCKEH